MKSFKNTDKWDAQHYKKHSEGQFKGGVHTINEINFRGNENVLDVGCGDGRITAEIAKHVPNGHVLGVDISQNMIKEAQKSFSNIKNLEFECIDAAHFSSEPIYDLSVSFAAFHWMKEQHTVLKNIFNALKPGGKLIIKMTAVCKSPISQVQSSKKWAEILSKQGQAHFPQTVDSFSKMLEATGFKNIEVKPKISVHKFQTKDELFNWTFVQVPPLTGLPEDKAREFTQDIVDSVCNARSDGQIILELASLDARAMK